MDVKKYLCAPDNVFTEYNKIDWVVKAPKSNNEIDNITYKLVLFC